MNVLNITALTPTIDKLHVVTPVLADASNIVGVGDNDNVKNFVMVKGNILYLVTMVERQVLISDLYTMVTGTTILNIDVIRINKYNVVLRYDDGIDVHYRSFTIFNTSLVLTSEDSSLYTGVDGWVDEVHNLSYIDGLLRKIVHKNDMLELLPATITTIETQLNKTITKAELTYNDVNTFILITTNDGTHYVFDNTDNKYIELNSTSSLVNGIDKLYILTEVNNEIANILTN